MSSPGNTFLVKHDLRSQRVKGVCFHAKRPWILVGLHSGCVHLIDHRTGMVVDRFEEHEGPVRGVDFHAQQPVFATGGDDCKIKIWSYKLRRCTSTLVGHLDYVRTVQFHREQPWLVSASDDQTLIIWNWQSRQRMSVLSGHNHYVMSAQFHPTQDLVVSASLDLSVRLWDIGGLRFKKQDQAFHNDLFGNTTDVATKCVLEGHEKGVNWASFHPTRPYIVSAADDRTIRIWRLEGDKAFEVDHLRGHTSNVSCVMYCGESTIISNSEDRTVRVWDSGTRHLQQLYRRDHERFWILNVHPEQNLIAAGHDNGLLIFKLERERPATCLINGGKSLLFVKDRQVQRYDFGSNNGAQVMCKLRRHTLPVRSISANAADNTIVVGYDFEGGVFEQFTLPASPGTQEADARRGHVMSPVFFAANKFAGLDKSNQINVRMVGSDQIKTLPPYKNTDRLFPGPQGFICCRSEDNFALYDVAQKAAVAEIAVPHVKYVAWDAGFQKAALLSKHHITVVTRRMKQVAAIHETTRIKSACFDDTLSVLIYTTHNHLKFCALQSGETGTLCTLDGVMYLVRVSNDVLWYVNRSGAVVEKRFDNTELSFKLALQQERYRDVLKLIQLQKVHGQALVAYLHKSGNPEIAMHFASDPEVKFNLAVECGLLDDAKAAAMELNTAECWRVLAAAAMKAGDIQLAQMANAKTKNFTSLGIQCAITGNYDALSQVMAKATDASAKLHLSMLNRDGGSRARVLAEAGQLPLAYCTARTHGDEELAQEILARMDPEVAARVQQQPLQALPDPSDEAEPEGDNWPMLPVQESYFMRMLKAPGEFDLHDDPAAGLGAAGAEGAWGDDDDDDIFGDKADNADDDDVFGAKAGGAAAGAAAGAAGGGAWEDSDLELDDLPPVDSGAAGATGGAAAGFVVPREGDSCGKQWTEATLLAPAHVAAGDFASAIQLLQRQIGLVDAKPLKQHFLHTWASCNGSMTGASQFPPHVVAMAGRALPGDTRSPHFPRLPRGVAGAKERLRAGYQEVTAGKFTDAVATFRGLLYQLLFVIVETQEEQVEVREMVVIARDYIAALNVELARKELNPAENVQRVVELAVYFTHYKLQPPHLILALNQGMKLSYKAKCLKTAGGLARRLLDLDPGDKIADQARRIAQAADAAGPDAVKLDYDERNPFQLCVVTKKPMYRGTVDPIRCPFTGATAHPSTAGQVCPVSLITALGAEATGMMNRVM